MQEGAGQVTSQFRRYVSARATELIGADANRSGGDHGNPLGRWRSQALLALLDLCLMNPFRDGIIRTGSGCSSGQWCVRNVGNPRRWDDDDVIIRIRCFSPETASF